MGNTKTIEELAKEYADSVHKVKSYDDYRPYTIQDFIAGAQSQEMYINNLKSALTKINQMSDCGDSYVAVIRMKEIASDALK